MKREKERRCKVHESRTIQELNMLIIHIVHCLENSKVIKWPKPYTLIQDGSSAYQKVVNFSNIHPTHIRLDNTYIHELEDIYSSSKPSKSHIKLRHTTLVSNKITTHYSLT